MRFTLSWLKDYLETVATPSLVTEMLTTIGLETELAKASNIFLSDIIVVHILNVQPHPKSDALKVCDIDTGEDIIQVICGAPNLRSGMKSLLARSGIIVPSSGKVITKSIIHGFESDGILCSMWELTLGEEYTNIIELPDDTLIASRASDILTLDPVLDASVTPNRSDCLGVRGIARDFSATGFGTYKTIKPVTTPSTFHSPLTITCVEKSLCPLFVGRFVRGIQNRSSPLWLQQRLLAIGLRSISALVDIANFVCLDVSRPLHIFDVDQLSGNILTVRSAKDNEIFTDTNSRTYTLQHNMIVISDAIGPQALAGIIGGQGSACSKSTTNIFIESALFDLTRIAYTKRALALDSESSYRFERGVDPLSSLEGSEIATSLIIDVCGGEASDMLLIGLEPEWRRALVLRLDKLRRVTGCNIPVSTIQNILQSVGCRVIEYQTGFIVTPPSWRRDLAGEHDLIEEVVRLNGYAKIPNATFPHVTLISHSLEQKQRTKIRRTLATRGLTEAVTWSFTSSTHMKFFRKSNIVPLINPISADLDILRPSLLPNLILAVRYNANYNMPNSAFFEIGPQFYGGKPGEQRIVAAGVRAGYHNLRHWAQSSRLVDSFDVKADALAVLGISGVVEENILLEKSAPDWYHPGYSGTIILRKETLGWFGMLHPHITHALDIKGPLAGFEIFLDALPWYKVHRNLLPKLPIFHPVVRDFSFSIHKDIPASKVLQVIRNIDKELIVAVSIFDIYTQPDLNKKSLAVSVTLQALEQTLTDLDITTISSRIVETVFYKTGATLRTNIA